MGRIFELGGMQSGCNFDLAVCEYQKVWRITMLCAQGGHSGLKIKKCAKTQVFIGIQQTQLYLRADDNSFTSQKFQIPDFPGLEKISYKNFIC